MGPGVLRIALQPAVDASYIDARYAILSSARANGFTAKQIAAIKAAFDAVAVTTSAL